MTLLILEATQHEPDALSRVMQGLLTGVGFLGAVEKLRCTDSPCGAPWSRCSMALGGSHPLSTG